MVSWQSKKLGDLLLLANGLALVVFVNLIANIYFFRIDLTEEKRFSIKEPTKEMLRNLDDDIYIEVFLTGDLNAGFRRFQKSIEETLEEFRIYSDNKVHFGFVDPETARSTKAQSEFIQELANKGISATNVVERKDGETATKLIFPGALISYGGLETGVMLLKGNKAGTPDEEINQSIEGIEYELASTIYKLTNLDRKRIGLIMGHDELDSLDIAAANNAMLEQFDVNKVDLKKSTSLMQYDVLIVAKPKNPFSEAEKYRLDQFIMNGGKAIFLLDRSNAEMDSASHRGYLATPLDVNLDDQLFKYGVRINYDLIQDKNSSVYPIVTGDTGGKPKMQLLEWPFFPLVNNFSEHPITRNLDAILTRFISTVDTVKAEGVRKVPLLLTTQYSHALGLPVNISVDELMRSNKEYSSGPLPVGYLLEGSFTSLYKKRFLPDGIKDEHFAERSIPTKIIVVSDGDIIRNDVNPRTGQPQGLGFDPFTQYTFANQDFLMNALAYLTNDNGLINARTKEIKIRPLDKGRVQTEKSKWQVINLVLPMVVVILYGVARYIRRKRKFARF